MSPRQPWYKEGRRPQRIETCSECGRTFRDKRDTDQALLQAIFGELTCPTCELKKQPTCVECNRPVKEPIYFNDDPYHSSCLPRE